VRRIGGITLSTSSDGNGTMTIAGNEIPFVRCYLPQADLRFYPENPRIHSIVFTSDEEPSQSYIEEVLTQKDHVKQLVQSIKANGGLIDPLLVRDRDFVVLEGNSRLAAYRLLARGDAIRWGRVKCHLLPKNNSDTTVFSLLCQYHVIGRTDWAPYEQAGILWRRYTRDGMSTGDLSREMGGLSAKKIRHMIDVYDFMASHDDRNVQHWSYYDEYLKSRAIQSRREQLTDLDHVVVQSVQCGKLKRAEDIRDKLAKVAAVHGRTGAQLMHRFVENPESLDACFERARTRDSATLVISKLERFRKFLWEPDTRQEIRSLPDRESCDRVSYELEKIRTTSAKLAKDLNTRRVMLG
jgi:hypothetical protein